MKSQETVVWNSYFADLTQKIKSIIFQAEEPTAELSNDAENIEMNEDEKQAFQYLNLQLSNLIQDLTKHKAQRYRQLWKLCINF